MDEINLSNASLLSLPNEILLNILHPLDTPGLLPLAGTCHRFHDLVLRIHHNRLNVAAGLGDRTLLLECYHPSLRLTEEPLHCTHLGTDGLDDSNAGIPHHDLPPGERMRQLNGLYTRFRPHRRDKTKRELRHPAGDVPGSRTHPSSRAAPPSPDKEPKNSYVKQLVNLDASEYFSQLTVITTLVKVGPKSGLFHSSVNVSEGVVRLFRNWLADHHDMGQAPADRQDGTKGLLWVNDGGNNVGVRFGVRERGWRNPVLIRADEDVAISYEIQIEEVIVRTRHLLLITEMSLKQQQSISGKAIVIGAWV